MPLLADVIVRATNKRQGRDKTTDDTWADSKTTCFLHQLPPRRRPRWPPYLCSCCVWWWSQRSILERTPRLSMRRRCTRRLMRILCSFRGRSRRYLSRWVFWNGFLWLSGRGLVLESGKGKWSRRLALEWMVWEYETYFCILGSMNPRGRSG